MKPALLQNPLKNRYKLSDKILFRSEGDFFVFYSYNNGSLSFYTPTKIELLAIPYIISQQHRKIPTKILKDLPHIVRNLEKNNIIKKIDTDDKLNENTSKFLEEILKTNINNYKNNPLRFNYPLFIGINPTNRCRFNCIYCYAEKKPVSELDLKSWEKIFNYLKKLNIRIVEITGGDLFSRNDAADFIQLLGKNNFISTISTKSKISQETAKQIAKSKNIKNILFQISLDSIDSCIDGRLTGVKDALNMAMESIRNLISHSIYPRVKAVITKYNTGNLEDFIKNMEITGVKEIALVSASKSYYRDNSETILTENQIKKLSEKIKILKNKYNRIRIYWQDGIIEPYKNKNEWLKRPICSAGRSSLIINPNGDITLCEQMPYKEEFIFGNILKSRLEEIWNSPKLLSFIYPNKKMFKKDSLCYNCKDFYICNIKGRCFRDSFFNYSTPFDAPPYCYKRLQLNQPMLPP